MGHTDRNFDSIDEAQNALSSEIFDSAQSSKKASGRAMGTLQEILAYSILHYHNLDDRIYLEYPLPEQGLKEVTHSVEFSIHPKVDTKDADVSGRKHDNVTLSEKDGRDIYNDDSEVLKKETLVKHNDEFDLVSTNPSLLKLDDLKDWPHNSIPIGRLNDNGEKEIVLLDPQPVGFIECKRVGLEEGTTSGPQTIEKAKQAAFVALRTSRLQKIVTTDGKKGVLTKQDGIESGEFEELWESKLHSDNPSDLRGIVRSILFFSDHGNWFPGGEESKDVKILKSSFDWAIWVEDEGLIKLVEFVLNDDDMRRAFDLHVDTSDTVLTKSKLESRARQAMFRFVEENWENLSEKWLTVLEPEGKSIDDLIEEFKTVTGALEN